MEGSSSGWTEQKKTVFQGTVFGCPLWNCYYVDASEAVQTTGWLDVVFAGDLNCTKIVPTHLSDEAAMAEAKECQQTLHKWGKANPVSFEQRKESLHLLHRTRGCGGNFVILGVEFDPALSMHSACQTIATEAGWILKTLLRTRRFHSTAQLVKLYKCQILSYIESRTEGMHHAATTTLDCIDRVQRRYLQEVGISTAEALVNWKLAPLSYRRAIAMLGLLYRIAMGLAPQPLSELFRRVEGFRGSTRSAERRHRFQFAEFGLMGGRTEHFRHSCFGLLTVWNMLPSEVVNCGSIKLFQRKLQNAVIARSFADESFETFFEQARRMRVPVFQQHFA